MNMLQSDKIITFGGDEGRVLELETHGDGSFSLYGRAHFKQGNVEHIESLRGLVDVLQIALKELQQAPEQVIEEQAPQTRPNPFE